MATTRLLRSTGPSLHHVSSSISTTTTSSAIAINSTKCKAELGSGDKKMVSCGDIVDKRKPKVVPKASMASSGSLITLEPTIDRGVIDIAALVAAVSNGLVKLLRSAVKPKLWKFKFHPQIFIEKIIIDCRFFTLFAVVGTLLGSVLCFLEGCFLILESYFQYFNTLSSAMADQQHIIHQLIEAIDMFLVGTAMLLFGVSLYAMFVGTRNSKAEGALLPRSNLFGLFHLKSLPNWVEMQSVSQAKSRIGHAVLMILQVGVMEKFKNIPVHTSLDLAYFAGAVFLSSTCIFLLSKLSSVGNIRSKMEDAWVAK